MVIHLYYSFTLKKTCESSSADIATVIMLCVCVHNLYSHLSNLERVQLLVPNLKRLYLLAMNSQFSGLPIPQSWSRGFCSSCGLQKCVTLKFIQLAARYIAS